MMNTAAREQAKRILTEGPIGLERLAGILLTLQTTREREALLRNATYRQAWEITKLRRAVAGLKGRR